MSQQPTSSVNDPLPLDSATIADPYPRYHQLRSEDPVHWHEGLGAWVLTRYSDVLGALRDQRLSADRIGALTARLPEPVQERIRPLTQVFADMMLMSDPPDHTRLRGLANKAFTPRVIDGMRSRIQANVDELLDGVANNGRMDIVADLAYPLPAVVISEMLGVVPADRDQFKKWSDDLAAFLGGIRMVAETVGAAQKSALEMTEYLRKVIAQRRTEPREDLISALVAVEEEGDRFSEAELFSMCILLLVAGHETTTNLIGNGLLALLKHPHQLNMLREDPALIETAVEEFLRYDSPVQSTARIAMEEMKMGGRRIAEGDRVSITLGGGQPRPGAVSGPGPAGCHQAGKQARGPRVRHPLLPWGGPGSNGRPGYHQHRTTAYAGPPACRSGPGVAVQSGIPRVEILTRSILNAWLRYSGWLTGVADPKGNNSLSSASSSTTPPSSTKCLKHKSTTVPGAMASVL